MTVNFVFNQAISYWTHNTTTSQKDNNNFNQKNSLKMCRWLHFELWKKTEIIRLNFFGLSKFDMKIKSDKNNTEFFLKKLTPLKVLILTLHLLKNTAYSSFFMSFFIGLQSYKRSQISYKIVQTWQNDEFFLGMWLLWMDSLLSLYASVQTATSLA